MAQLLPVATENCWLIGPQGIENKPKVGSVATLSAFPATSAGVKEAVPWQFGVTAAVPGVTVPDIVIVVVALGACEQHASAYNK